MPQLKKWLNRSVEFGYYERDERWQAGKFSMGYRIGEKWQVTHRSRVVNLLPAEKRKDRRKSKFRLPVLEMLVWNVGTIGLEGTPGFDDELEAMEKEKLERTASITRGTVSAGGSTAASPTSAGNGGTATA